MKELSEEEILKLKKYCSSTDCKKCLLYNSSTNKCLGFYSVSLKLKEQEGEDKK